MRIIITHAHRHTHRRRAVPAAEPPSQAEPFHNHIKLQAYQLSLGSSLQLALASLTHIHIITLRTFRGPYLEQPSNLSKVIELELDEDRIEGGRHRPSLIHVHLDIRPHLALALGVT